MPLNITRHIDVFSPDDFGARRVDVIGVGASGSRIVLSLAKLGIENIHVWDDDIVEAHNVPNQAFGMDDVGKLKVEALKEIVKRQTGIDITTHAERVDGKQVLGEVVFLLTDTMSSRKQIWNAGLKYKSRTKLMIETRMGSDQGRVYVVNPTTPAHVRGWEAASDYGDEVAEVSACGASISVGPTAEFLSGLAVWQLITWFAIQQKKVEVPQDNEILYGLREPTIVRRRFK
jgi:molybdopterin/thiamine biosynthesis adenylyltransferase